MPATFNSGGSTSVPVAGVAARARGGFDQARQAAEQVLGANPVVGVTRDELLDAGRRLIRMLSLNPALVARKQAALTLECARILAGRSDIRPEPGDRRFQAPVWRNNAYYRRLLQMYLAWAECLREIVAAAPADPLDRERARFMANQLIAAAAPTNTPFGNPGFIANARQSNGLSILRGLRNLVDDVVNNHAMPRQVDSRPFKPGKNLAASPGAVVFRNTVCEVIQYAPRTARVEATPLLIVPPQINKFYVLDLAPNRSFIEYAVSQGQQVFCISWRNPTPAQRDWGLETYVTAAEAALDAVLEITASPTANMMAACAGGITAAVIAGHLAAVGKAERIHSLTLLVTVLDTGADTLLGLFANDPAIAAAVARSRRQGVLDGAQMARAFAWLRPQDLVWGFVANNYVMGNQPPAFDILYWNSDTTRLPAQFHADLLDVFRHNPLVRANGMKMLGTPIDLKQVTCDVFIIAGINDHITPWRACYGATRMFGGNARFVLSSSGHIQSIVNPPEGSKARYFLNDNHDLPADQWLEQAEAHPGSWWGLWLDWVRGHAGGSVEAPDGLGSEQHPPGQAAPGRYIHQR